MFGERTHTWKEMLIETLCGELGFTAASKDLRAPLGHVGGDTRIPMTDSC